ncbi:MAG: ATP synthase F0 subunit C [Nitrospirae bacterium]|nr:ATP synthase F0 subunit C [Nitrospirota bacterium]
MIQISIGIAAIGLGFVGIGLGFFFGKLLEGIARNPGAMAEMNRFVFLGFALIETIAIYILVLAFLLYGKI